MRNRIVRLVAFTAVLMVGLTATSFAAESAEAERTFYLRGEGCGETQDLYLSVGQGADGHDGCGAFAGLPANELLIHVNGPSPKVFPTRDGVPVTLDATRDLTGTIRAESWFDEDAPGVGQVVVDIAVSGTRSTGTSILLGSVTEEAVNAGEYGVQVPFTFDIPAAYDRLSLTNLTISVEVHGVNFNSSNLGLESDSWFTLPIVLPTA